MNKKKEKSKIANLRRQADYLWFMACVKKHGNNCEICGGIGQQVHHFFPKNSFGYIRYDLDNGVVLCKGCHFKLHFTHNPLLAEKIIKNRGRKWYNKLKKKAEEKHYSYRKVSWYKEHIEKLQKIIGVNTGMDKRA